MNASAKNWIAAVWLLFGCTPLFAQSEEEEEGKASLRETVPPESDPIAEQLIETTLKAMGGRDRFLQLQNVKATMDVRMGKDDYEQVIYYGEPDKVRIETITRRQGQEFKVIEGYDGENAWIYDLTREHPFPKKLGGKRKQELAAMADFHGDLVDWKQQGFTPEYLGSANSRRFKNWVVKLYDPDGIPAYYYFDAKNYLLTRRGNKEIRNDVVVDHDVYFTKYEKFRGVFLPVVSELVLEDQTYGTITVTRYEFDQSYPPGFFEIPQVKEVWLKGQNAR